MNRFEWELAWLFYHYVRVKGYPEPFLRQRVADYITEDTNPFRARAKVRKYILFLCTPNGILEPSARWRKTLKTFAEGEDSTDTLPEHVCELLKRYYPAYQQQEPWTETKKV